MCSEYTSIANINMNTYARPFLLFLNVFFLYWYYVVLYVVRIKVDYYLMYVIGIW